MSRRLLRALAGASLVGVTGVHAGLLEDIAAKKDAVEALRTQLTPRVAPLLVKDADARVFLSLAPLVQGVAVIAALPAGARTITINSTGANGQFWEDGDWCHSFVELQGPGDLHATAELTNIAANLLDNGGIQLTTRAVTSGKVQVKFQFMGKRVKGPFGIGNVCPPGGGVGSPIGVTFSKTIDLALQVALSASADGKSLAYSAAFVSPDEVSVTAEIGLGPIGKLGQPMKFALPKTPIATGSFPLLVAQEGKFKLPGNAGDRAYSLVFVPKSFVVNRAGVTASWKSTVQFK